MVVLFILFVKAFALAIANDGTTYTTVEETPTGYYKEKKKKKQEK